MQRRLESERIREERHDERAIVVSRDATEITSALRAV
jgi:hypothetical protein